MSTVNHNKNLLSVSSRFTTYFKIFLIFGVVAIGGVFVYYTQDVIADIQANEAEIAQTYTKIWALVASDSVSGPVTSVLFDEVILKSNFPIVVTDSVGNPLFWKEVPGLDQADADPRTLERVRRYVEELDKKKGEIPIYIDSVVIYNLYYGDTALIGKLRVIPIVEMGLFIGFVFLALVGFQHIRRSEQRSIWVGMAKETAHQMGTPITSLLGWIDLLKSGRESETFSRNDIYSRIESDVARLETVANRFGRIGSIPKLEPLEINRITGDVINYFRQRLPHGGSGVRLHFDPGEELTVNLNEDLYRWVIENLIKNSLEAVDSRSGQITVRTYRENGSKNIKVEVADNGRGIDPHDARRVFRPGYTTKRRGWGLGLSLARRIIHDYHKGTIVLASGEQGKGARFVITLPIA